MITMGFCSAWEEEKCVTSLQDVQGKGGASPGDFLSPYPLSPHTYVSMMSPSLLLSVNEAQSRAWSSTKPICRTHTGSRGDLRTVRDTRRQGSWGASGSSLRSDLSLYLTLGKPKYSDGIYNACGFTVCYKRGHQGGMSLKCKSHL